jgi:hypothetical protein
MPPTPWRAALVLLLVTLACHALLPFTDYLCFDDLWLVNWVQNQHFDWLREFYNQAGSTTGYWYFRSFGFVGNITTTFKVIAVVVCFLNGWFVYRIGERSGFLGRNESLLVGVATIAFPAYKFNGGFIYSAYEVPLTVFLTAVLLAVKSDAVSGWKHWLPRGCALCLFAVSFIMASLLTFYGAFFFLLVLLHQRSAQLLWYRIPWAYCLRRLDYFVLPFVYWICKTTFDPTSGVYTEYNKPTFSLEAVVAGYQTLPTVVFDPLLLFASFTGLKQLALVGVSLLLLFVVDWVVRRSDLTPAAPTVRLTRTAGLLLFGLLLLVLGTAPYIAVKKYFSPWGVQSSYTPLIPFALAVLLLALVNGCRRAAPRLGGVVLLGLSIGLVLCVTTWWHNYLSLQAVKVRNESIMARVHHDPVARECTVFCVQNDFRIPRTIADDIHTWQWTFLECGATGQPHSIAYNGLPGGSSIPEDQVKLYIEQTTMAYALTSVDPGGKQGILLIRQGPGFHSVSSASLKYLYLKHFRPDRLEPFLESVTEVDFLPAPWRQPVGQAVAGR